MQGGNARGECKGAIWTACVLRLGLWFAACSRNIVRIGPNNVDILLYPSLFGVLRHHYRQSRLKGKLLTLGKFV